MSQAEASSEHRDTPAQCQIGVAADRLFDRKNRLVGDRVRPSLEERSAPCYELVARRGCQNKRARVIDAVAGHLTEKIDQLALLVHQRGRARHHRRTGRADRQLASVDRIAGDQAVAGRITRQSAVWTEQQRRWQIVDDARAPDIFNPPFALLKCRDGGCARR